MAKYILIIGILASLLIRGFFISQSKQVADIYLMYTMGATFLGGRNPYLVLDFNSYPPLAIFIEAASMLVSAFLHTSFATIFKLWPNLADFISAFIIYIFLIKAKNKPVQAALWSVFFLLNPISIIISSAHGQLDSVVSLFVLVSIFLLTFYSKKLHIYLSALILGIAIGFKPNPAMLIPLFLFYKKTTLQQKIIYLILTLAPLIVSFIPFVWPHPQQVLLRILSYSGTGDISYAAILRGIWYQNNAITNLPLAGQFLNASKFVFTFGAITLTLLFAGRKNLAKACLAIYLLFLSSYFGIAAQYLVWVIPLAILVRDKMIFYYIFFALFALLGFYLFFGPDILLGKISNLVPFQTKYMYLYFFGNLALWVFTLGWLIKIIKSYAKNNFLTFGIIHKRLIYFGCALSMLSLFPMIYFLVLFFQLYALEG